jgi:hypothetical protein
VVVVSFSCCAEFKEHIIMNWFGSFGNGEGLCGLNVLF